MRGISALILLVLSAGTAQAQRDSASNQWPALGSRVLVWTTDERRVVGDLINVRGDTLVVRTSTELSPELAHIPVGRVELVPASAIARIDVSSGRGFQAEHVLGGAVLGAVAGVALAATANAALRDFGGPGVDYGDAAAVGAAVGAVLGAATPGDRWEEHPASPPTFAPVRVRRGVRLTPSFR